MAGRPLNIGQPVRFGRVDAAEHGTLEASAIGGSSDLTQASIVGTLLRPFA